MGDKVKAAQPASQQGFWGAEPAQNAVGSAHFSPGLACPGAWTLLYS